MNKVLVVEDSAMIAYTIKTVLESEGIKTITTQDGSKVVELIKTEGIELVILDLMMPKISGQDVYKMIKADSQTKNTKIMIMTAKTDALKWNEFLKGCDKFMTKPFDNKVLVTEVKKLLK